MRLLERRDLAQARRPRPTTPRPGTSRSFTSRLLRGAAAAALAAGSIAVAIPAAAQAAVPAAARPGAASGDGVSSVPVSFTVHNVNRSAFACASDGKTYTVHGHLVGPSAQVASSSASGATLYLHGLNFGEFLWSFTDVPGYDYATESARAGQISIIIDRLGYGTSDKPAGTAICAGSRADIAHQMVQAMRSGNYRTGSGPAPAFRHVALAGHSYGGQIAELEAYSFGDIDALAVISYTDQGSTALAASSAAFSTKACAAGGQPVAPGGPGGYAPFGDPNGARAAVFGDTDPVVVAAGLPKLTLNPCGDMVPFNDVATADLAHLGKIGIPVLEVSGGGDKLFPVSAGDAQVTLFTGSSRVTRLVVPGAGHAITLARQQGALVSGVSGWLATTSVGGTPSGGVGTGVGQSPDTGRGLLAAGGLAVVAAAGTAVLAMRRRRHP